MAIYFSDGQQNRAAHVINCDTINVQTRYVPTTNGSDTNPEVFMNFGAYNKLEANSDLHFVALVFCKNNGGSRALTLQMYYGSSIDSSTQIISGGTAAAYPGSGYHYDSNSWSHYVMSVGVIKGSDHNTTGNQNFILGHRAGNSNSGNRPAGICNPSSSDDGRYVTGVMGSRLNVMEVLQV